MKRLPKKFFIVSPDYIQPHKYSVKLGGIISRYGKPRIWYINETIAIYSYRKTARNAGHALAQAYHYGYIEDVKRGEVYTRKHRADMFLYNR